MKKIFGNRCILFFLILAIGVFARVWEFRGLPPGLNQDEASIGVEAYSLLHYGVDRNNVSYPVYFTAWGAGQNVLYGYLLIPFVAVFGLRPLVVRLPMLLLGITTLPLVYLAGRKILDENFGLLGMFFMAISPWHILLSRWGLEANLLPFLFLIAFIFLLYAERGTCWFVPSLAFFGLCFYTYGTSYFCVPFFLLCAVLVLYFGKRLNFKPFLLGLLVFAIISLPIGLYIIVNTFQLNTISIGLMTIPRLPAQSRYEAVGAMFNGDFLQTVRQNLPRYFKVFVLQTDGYPYNVVESFGYFYTFTFPLALFGGGLLAFDRFGKRMENLLLFSWLLTGLILGFLQPANINRVNIAFIPLIISVAFFVRWLSRTNKTVLPLTLAAFFVGFLFFNYSYHSAPYRAEARKVFFPGFLAAVELAGAAQSAPVCISDTRINSPFVYVMFAEPMDPVHYLENMEYTDQTAQVRPVRRLGRYTFGLQNCVFTRQTVYLLFYKEHPPRGSRWYTTHRFGNYVVYIPRRELK